MMKQIKSAKYLMVLFVLLLGLGGNVLPAFAATTTLYAGGDALLGGNGGLTAPQGVAWIPGALGGHLWISDHAAGLCRLDPDPTHVGLFRLTNCANQLIAGAGGTIAFDAVHNFIFVADVAANSNGVHRFPFNAATETLGQPISFGGGLRTRSVAYDPVANVLYVGERSSGNINKITTPNTTPSAPVKVANATRKPVNGMAVLNGNLYVADGGGFSVVQGIAACTGGCNAALVLGSQTANASAVVAQAPNLVWYAAGDTNRVWRHDTTTNAETLTANCTTMPIGGCDPLVLGTSALALDTTGNLFVADTPGLGVTPNVDRVSKIVAP
ncbi:MAG: hypothetical protein U0350_28435 [Caldilineaceae bacterium]